MSHVQYKLVVWIRQIPDTLVVWMRIDCEWVIDWLTVYIRRVHESNTVYTRGVNESSVFRCEWKISRSKYFLSDLLGEHMYSTVNESYVLSHMYSAHQGDPTKNIWIWRSFGFSDTSFERRGLRLLNWKRVWNCGGSHENVLDMYGDSSEYVLNLLAVVIILSLMSCVAWMSHVPQRCTNESYIACSRKDETWHMGMSRVT